MKIEWQIKYFFLRGLWTTPTAIQYKNTNTWGHRQGGPERSVNQTSFWKEKKATKNKSHLSDPHAQRIIYLLYSFLSIVCNVS